MTTEQQFINYLNKQGYIDTPTDFFYTNAPESLPLVEGLRMIYLHNKNIIETLREENITLTQTLNIQTQYPSPKKEEPVKEIPQEEILPRKEIKVLDLLTHTNDLTTITKIIDQSTKEEKPYIKLYYYKKLQDTKLELLHIISTNPLQISAARFGSSGEIISISLPSAAFSIRVVLCAINTIPYPSIVILRSAPSNSFLQPEYPPPHGISPIFCTPFCAQINCSQ